MRKEDNVSIKIKYIYVLKDINYKKNCILIFNLDKKNPKKI